jgi:hypothetical protein
VAMLHAPADSAAAALVAAEYACWVLLRLAAEEKVRSPVLDAGAPRAVVAALRAHPSALPVQLRGAWALSNFSASSYGEGACISAGGIAAAVAALGAATAAGATDKTAALAAQVAQYASSALQRMTSSSESKAALLEEGGGIATLLHAMAALPSSAEAQFAGCKLLLEVASTDEAKVALVRLGALSAAVAALRGPVMPKPAVAEHACWVLMRLSTVPEGLAAALAPSFGALEGLVGALRTHGAPGAEAISGSSLAASRACSALYNLCGGPECPAWGLGAHAAIVAALRTHALDKGVVEQALKALREVSAPAAARAAGVQAGSHAAACAALRAFPQCADVAQHACALLLRLAVTEGGALLEAGTPVALVGALRIHAGVLGVVTRGVWALGELSSSPAGRAACLGAGALAVIVRALREHGATDLQLAGVACKAFCALAEGGGDALAQCCQCIESEGGGGAAQAAAAAALVQGVLSAHMAAAASSSSSSSGAGVEVAKSAELLSTLKRWALRALELLGTAPQAGAGSEGVQGAAAQVAATASPQAAAEPPLPQVPQPLQQTSAAAELLASPPAPARPLLQVSDADVWVPVISRASGNTYYKNARTGEKTWKVVARTPGSPTAAPSSASAGAEREA